MTVREWLLKKVTYHNTEALKVKIQANEHAAFANEYKILLDELPEEALNSIMEGTENAE